MNHGLSPKDDGRLANEFARANDVATAVTGLTVKWPAQICCFLEQQQPAVDKNSRSHKSKKSNKLQPSERRPVH